MFPRGRRPRETFCELRAKNFQWWSVTQSLFVLLYLKTKTKHLNKNHLIKKAVMTSMLPAWATLRCQHWWMTHDVIRTNRMQVFCIEVWQYSLLIWTTVTICVVISYCVIYMRCCCIVIGTYWLGNRYNEMIGSMLDCSNAFASSLVELLKTEVSRCNNVQKILAAIDV